MMHVCAAKGRPGLVELNGFRTSWLSPCDPAAVVGEAGGPTGGAWEAARAATVEQGAGRWAIQGLTAQGVRMARPGRACYPAGGRGLRDRRRERPRGGPLRGRGEGRETVPGVSRG